MRITVGIEKWLTVPISKIDRFIPVILFTSSEVQEQHEAVLQMPLFSEVILKIVFVSDKDDDRLAASPPSPHSVFCPAITKISRVQSYKT